MEEGPLPDTIGEVCKGQATLVQDFHLYSNGKEKPLKAFKQRGDNCICILERSPSLHDWRRLSVRRQMRRLEEYRWKTLGLGLGGGVEAGRNGGFVIWGLVTGRGQGKWEGWLLSVWLMDDGTIH